MSFIKYFIIFILFIFTVIVLTGMGILTTAIFDIKNSTCPSLIPGTKNPDTVKFVSGLPAISIPNMTGPLDSAQLKAITDAIPTQTPRPTLIDTGDYALNLSALNLTVCKISLIGFWILITIFFMYIIYAHLVYA